MRSLAAIAAASVVLPLALPQAPRRTQDPDSVLYQAFFRQVAETEAAAAALRAKGRSDREARDLLKTRIGLNEAEDNLVREVARSCLAEYEAESRRGAAIVRGLRDQYGKAAEVPAEVAAQINGLEEARNRLTATCADRLRSRMGSRFERLDAFVRQTVGPRIRRADPETKQ